MNQLFDIFGDLLPFLIFVIVGLFGLIKRSLEQKTVGPETNKARKPRNAVSTVQKAETEVKGKASSLTQDAYQQAREKAQSTFEMEKLVRNRYKDRSKEIMTFNIKKENVVQGIIWSEVLGKPRAYNPISKRNK